MFSISMPLIKKQKYQIDFVLRRIKIDEYP